MLEPHTTETPVDALEPQVSRQDAISELSERLAFAFAWMLDARDSKAVALRVYVAAHHFCPSYLRHETLAKTGDRDRKSTRLNSSHVSESRMPSSA